MSLRGHAALSLILGVLQGLLSVSLRRVAHLCEAVSVTQGLCTFLLMTLGVPMSLGEIPMTPQALAQGSLISCSPGRRWKGHTHTYKGTCSASCNYGGGVPKGAALSGVSVHPAQSCSSPGRSGILPLRQIPSSPTPDQPLLCSSPFSAQRPFPGVIPSVSPSRSVP